MSEEDERELTTSVHIIFHIAATVKFDAPLRDAVNLNVRGTERLLKLATKMSKLEVSTVRKIFSIFIYSQITFAGMASRKYTMKKWLKRLMQS